VVVKALVDDRVVAAGVPVALEGPRLGTVFVLSGAVIRARHELDPGTRYHVWSYVPDPAPADLAAAPARYPREARRFLTVWGRMVPPFGAPEREAETRELLGNTTYRALRPYRPLYRQARSLTRRAENPYEAVLAIESWLRRTGGFSYDEQPTVQTRDLPPLVEFATVTKAGYCQHFAGAMAVMLRLLGIPSRVAVGFTSGTYEDGRWKVTDHNAHAWVEVWFPGQGWVPFDPTPGRGTFSGTYSYASENAQAVAALGRGEITGGASVTRGSRGGSSNGTATPGRSEHAPSIVAIALLVGASWVLLVVVAKFVRRRLGLLARDPRRAATATRRELEAFLRDQQVEIPPSATLGWLRAAARDELGLDAGAFTALAARARFGPPEAAADAARLAREELRALLRKARRELSLWARARGVLSLRSFRGGHAA
jgi:transglutaminase-like putative cysteine protease